MIKELDKKTFLIEGKTTSLALRINEVGKVVTEYYGDSLGEIDDISPLIAIYPSLAGRSVVYDETLDPNISLNYIHSDFSTPNKGDFLSPSAIFVSEDCCTYDFIYSSHEIISPKAMDNYPTPYDAESELVINLVEKALNLEIELHYICYEDCDVIGRYIKVKNNGEILTTIKKISSLSLSLLNKNYNLVSFHGSWVNEFKKSVDKIGNIRYSFDSTTGSSSDFHNPLFFLMENKANFTNGNVYGFNLIYAGNHHEEVEMNNFGQVRINSGISPMLFEWKLKQGESFETPMAIMSFSSKGSNGVAHNFHDFVNNHISPRGNKGKPRPIVYNSWESVGMDIKSGKLKTLIKKCVDLGIEMFVMDDGWFGNRDDETKGLGDWFANKKKLPGDVIAISEYTHKKGLQFGIWVEPEAVSPDSELYKEHPDWIIKDSLHTPSKGRHQWTIDLTNKEVVDYLFSRLSSIISEGKVDFIKWDYNRMMSDIPYKRGTFYHRYILGLYDLLKRLREVFPTLWMENCASGGSRNDLSMFSYFDTGWVSDDTDSYERSLIQMGMLFGYPPSIMSNHVSAKTSNQMLRKTSFGTKFDIASIGILGYEFDITKLDPVDEKEIKSEIEFYKENRQLFQYGIVDILEEYQENNRLIIEVHDKDKAATLYVNLLQLANPPRTYLPLVGLDEDAIYEYSVRKEGIDLHKFGNMINYASPIKLHEDGALVNMIARRMNYPNEEFEGALSGKALNAGALRLAPEWAGDGIAKQTRLIGDFGARLYIFKKKSQN